MLQGLQLSAFPSSSPQAELHYYRTVAAQAAYCGDACVFQREMKVKITTYSGDVHPPSSPPPPPACFPELGAGRPLRRGRGKNKMAAQPLQIPNPAQPPPALHMQDLKHLPDGCWLLIRTVSSQRPAGKPAGSLELASRSLPSFLELYLKNVSAD